MVKLVKSAVAASLTVASTLTAAEDIDLFMGLASGSTASLPNVLIIIDNTANWNTAFEAEMSALAATVAGLRAGKVRLGFMLYTETGGGNGNPDGGYVRAAVRTMSEDTKPLYQALVESLDKNDDKSNNGKLGLTMSEVDRYFSGREAYAGHNKVKRDYTNNSVSGLDASNAIYALRGNALSTDDDNTYVSPSDTSGCQKNYVVFLSNGKSDANNSDNRTATDHLRDVGGDTTPVAILPSGYQDDVADEWARYMANKIENAVITYTIDVVPTVRGQYSEDYQALLRSIATQGQGKYFNVGSSGASDLGSKIQETLGQVFGEIAAVNSAYSAASLPVSVNTQGVYLNQVFIGMFRPDRNALPRWYGNLKQYQIAVAPDGTLNLADSNTPPDLAINTLTGFITPCALSYWTPTGVDTYWTYRQDEFPNPCPTVANAAASNSPDGDIVEKGAAAYRLRAIAPNSRVVKACTGTCAELADFSTANDAITTASLGVGDEGDPAQARVNLINWVRGQDIDDEDVDLNYSEMRPSAHGDVIHSRPLAVDYSGDTGVVVFYGANDGMLHAVEGNQALADGDELWSFVAPEHFSKLKRLRNNTPPIKFTAPETEEETESPIPEPKDYFFDGSVGGFRKDASTIWIYPTMRRGGRRVYAFDVSVPSSPELMWRRGCPGASDSDCDTGFEDIGETWSEVQVLYAAGYLDDSDPPAPKPIAIFGGGYDTCEDKEPNTCTTPRGDHIYVLDAETGERLTTFDTDRSVAADITMVDRNYDGQVEFAYAVDTGGNLYRVNIGTAAPRDWTLTQVAALGCDTFSDSSPCSASGTLNRKFLYAPEVVVVGTDQNAVLVGSGDREHPLDTNKAVEVDNAFFMVKDKPGNPNWLADEDDNCGGQELICMASLLPIAPEGDNPATEELNAKKGWALTFGTDTDGVVHNGEQVVTSAIVVGGVVYFSTHTPTASTRVTCGPNLGTARAYGVGFWNAASPTGTTIRFDEMVAGGLPPSPVGGLVEIGDSIYPFIIGGRQLEGGGTSGLEVQNAGLVVSGVRSRTYWYIEPLQ